MNDSDRGIREKDINLSEAAHHYKMFLDALGANMDDCNLRDTPMRVAKMWGEFLSPQDFKFTKFDSDKYDEMIMCGPVPFYSMCAHHNLPFFGTAYVAYIPGQDGQIVGISKLARTVQWYAAGFQNQERITKQVAETLQRELQPKGVAVLLKARHLCMEMRGAKTHDCETKTSTLTGVFQSEPETRAEFYSLINK